MAKYKPGQLGQFIGKIGDTVGYYQNGRYCTRKVGKPSNPNTPKQQEQRARFALHAKCAHGLLTAARVGLQQKAKHTTEYGALVSQLFKLNGDLAHLQLSHGRYLQIEGLELRVSGPTATLTWRGPAGSEGDLAYVAIASADEAHSASQCVPLTAGRAEFQLPEGFSADFGYAFISNSTRKLVGPTSAATQQAERIQ